jgi:ElaB/YqjD/DUF883 family membrane-anchored ribosome-binding protein
MDDTRAALSEKLGTLEQRMVDTMHDAADAVAQTVDNVKDAVHDTVESVKDTFDLRHQVDRHPWAMVGGSIALGFVGGYLLVRRGATQPTANGAIQHAAAATPPFAAPHNGTGARPLDDTAAKPNPEPVQVVAERACGNGANHPFGTEIAKLKKLAIGTLLSIVRDMITRPAPQTLQAGLTEVIDGITIQLGGEPIRGPVLRSEATAN